MDMAVLAPTAAVHSVWALDHAMCQSFDVLWWKLLEESGREMSLADVRKCIGKRREREGADVVSGVSTDPAHGLR